MRSQQRTLKYSLSVKRITHTHTKISFSSKPELRCRSQPLRKGDRMMLSFSKEEGAFIEEWHFSVFCGPTHDLGIWGEDRVDDMK